MPGKINPSIAEAMNMICHSVMGAQQALNVSVQAGQLELNVMMPHIDFELTRSEDLMTNGMEMFRNKLINGLEPDEKSSAEHLAHSFGSAALMNPYLGYDTVASIVKEAIETGKSIKELALKTGRIDARKFDEIMASGIPK
jgi:fumarate hydratase class II/aspartate ammonia-lyase